MATIEIGGQQCNVIGSTAFTHKGEQRTELKLQKPRGKRVFYVAQYADGSMSSVA